MREDDVESLRAEVRQQMDDLNRSLAAIEYRAVPLAEGDEIAALIAALRPEAGARPLIRLGGAGDGGYLVPDDLDGVVTCFSPGVSDRAEFDLALADRDARVFLADASVDGPPVFHPRFHFEKRFLGDALQPGRIRLADWVAANADPADSEMLLQMDIEGDEYRVLLDTPPSLLRRFRILVIEFHDLGSLLHGATLRFHRHLFARLLRDFAVVHIHPNNATPVARFGGIEIPEVMEFTFHRRDRHLPSGRRLEFPHPLDSANLASRPDLVLPACWRPAEIS